MEMPPHVQTGKNYIHCQGDWRLSASLRASVKPLSTIVLWYDGTKDFRRKGVKWAPMMPTDALAVDFPVRLFQYHYFDTLSPACQNLVKLFLSDEVVHYFPHKILSNSACVMMLFIIFLTKKYLYLSFSSQNNCIFYFPHKIFVSIIFLTK